MNFEELKALVEQAAEENSGLFEEDIPDTLECVSSGKWQDDYKYQHCSDVYRNDKGEYFLITNSRSGSYHTDYFYSPPEVYRVEKEVKMIEKTYWNQI